MGIQWIDNGIMRVGVDDTNGCPRWWSLSNGSQEVLNTQNGYENADHSVITFTMFGNNTTMNDESGYYTWNPNQAGSNSGSTAPVLLEISFGPSSFYAKVIPGMFFDLTVEDNIPDAIMEVWYTLEGSILKARCKFTYSGPNRWGNTNLSECFYDKKSNSIQYNNEVPAFCGISGMDYIHGYIGNQPWTGAPLTDATTADPTPFLLYADAHGTLERVAYTDEYWIAYTDANGFGVGNFNPYNLGVFNGGYSPTPFLGHGWNTGDIVDVTSYFTFGTVSQIRSRFQALNSTLIINSAVPADLSFTPSIGSAPNIPGYLLQAAAAVLDFTPTVQSAVSVQKSQDLQAIPIALDFTPTVVSIESAAPGMIQLLVIPSPMELTPTQIALIQTQDAQWGGVSIELTPSIGSTMYASGLTLNNTNIPAVLELSPSVGSLADTLTGYFFDFTLGAQDWNQASLINLTAAGWYISGSSYRFGQISKDLANMIIGTGYVDVSWTSSGVSNPYISLIISVSQTHLYMPGGSSGSARLPFAVPVEGAQTITLRGYIPSGSGLCSLTITDIYIPGYPNVTIGLDASPALLEFQPYFSIVEQNQFLFSISSDILFTPFPVSAEQVHDAIGIPAAMELAVSNSSVDSVLKFIDLHTIPAGVELIGSGGQIDQVQMLMALNAPLEIDIQIDGIVVQQATYLVGQSVQVELTAKSAILDLIWPSIQTRAPTYMFYNGALRKTRTMQWTGTCLSNTRTMYWDGHKLV